jgi:hypothetical protein
MKRLIVSVVALLWGVPIVIAAPLQVSRVPGDAQWVAHLDVRAMVDSQLGRFVLAEVRKAEGNLDAKLGAVRELIGLDLLNDVHGITLYGPVLGDEQGVVILHARLNRQKLLTLLRANDTFRQHLHGKHACYQWTDKPKGDSDKPGKTQFGCFHGDDLAVIASRQDLLYRALDVLDGTERSLSDTDALASLRDEAAGSFVVAAVDNLNEAAQRNRDAAILRNVVGASLRAGEHDGQTFVHVAVRTSTDQAAVDIREIMEGAVALGRMLRQHDDLAVLQNLNDSMRVGGAGRVASLDLNMPSESLTRVLGLMVENEHRKHRDAAHDHHE